ncbi:MAG: hypothetical protein ACE37F_20650 [Nannocystaceae bacterium]|nr:hypothetical protein [bacterium]
MGDELLEALAKRQRELDQAEPALAGAVEGDAGEALLDGLFAELDAQPETKPKKSKPDPEKVVELPKRRSPVWAAAAALVLAAALLLWFARPTPPPALPEYRALSVSGGAAAVRGEHDGVASELQLHSQRDTVRLEFAAAKPVNQAVRVSLLARRPSGAAVFAPLDDLHVSDSGSFRIRGPLERFIRLSEGQWTLEVIVAPESHAPESADEAASGDWQRVPIEVIIAAP